MNSLISYFESEFNTQREQWEKSLLSELKLTEVGNKATKKLLHGATWPTLSLQSKVETRLEPTLTWKKASTTYVKFDESSIQEDLKAGVKTFFFFGDHDSQKLKTFFSSDSNVEFFILGKGNIISGEAAHFEGGDSIQELALLTKNLIERASTEDKIYLGVYVDSMFFHNIAKVRAARLLGQRVLEELGSSKKIEIVALTSFMNWTIFERYSNMLRNLTAVASSYIGGADHIQSCGYNVLHELETNEKSGEHSERSQRMARNTSHVLALESMLGVVHDASYGSHHIENLTQYLCEESWKLMQKLLKGHDLSKDTAAIREQRLAMIKTRKTVLSGINDYPDMKEKLHLELKAPKLFRLARVFEDLRIQMNKKSKPSVSVALYGDYGALNARLNFVKNYFELLGLEVKEPGHSITDENEFKKSLSGDVVVLCALDDDYTKILPHLKTDAKFRFIAGKVEVEGYKNLFAGQNVYDVLANLVKELN